MVHVHSGVLRVHVLRCSTVYDSPPPPPLGRPVIDRADTLLGGISLFFENSRERETEKDLAKIVLFLQYANFTLEFTIQRFYSSAAF